MENVLCWQRKVGKKVTTDRIELPSLERIRTFGEKENNEYLGIVEEDTIIIIILLFWDQTQLKQR